MRGKEDGSEGRGSVKRISHVQIFKGTSSEFALPFTSTVFKIDKGKCRAPSLHSFVHAKNCYQLDFALFSTPSTLTKTTNGNTPASWLKIKICRKVPNVCYHFQSFSL